MLVQTTPGTAASQAQVVITTTDGTKHVVKADQVRQNASIQGQTIPVYDGKTTNQLTIPYGLSLQELLALVTPPFANPDAIKTIRLERSGGDPIFVHNDARIIFYTDDSGATIGFQRQQDEGNPKDPNAPDSGVTTADDTKLRLDALAGQALKVTASASPSDNVHAGDTVTFKATVKKPGDGTLTYTWDFGDGATDQKTTDTTTHVYTKKRSVIAVVEVTRAADDSGGTASVAVNVKKKVATGTGSGGTGTGGSGSGTGTGTGTGSGGGTGSGTGGSFVPTPPSTTSPSLPPPATPPPASSGSTPNNPGFDTTPSVGSGTEVTGILVSAPAGASKGGDSGKPTGAKQPNQNSKGDSLDWKIPGGAALAALLLILGALREHMPTRRLLPHAT
jgi:hypothetical protein